MLLRLLSLRLNGSYEDDGVNWTGVDADIFDVDDDDTSIAFFRALIKRNSRSISCDREWSITSRASSLTGSSASICCFKILRT